MRGLLQLSRTSAVSVPKLQTGNRNRAMAHELLWCEAINENEPDKKSWHTQCFFRFRENILMKKLKTRFDTGSKHRVAEFSQPADNEAIVEEQTVGPPGRSSFFSWLSCSCVTPTGNAEEVPLK